MDRRAVVRGAVAGLSLAAMGRAGLRAAGLRVQFGSLTSPVLFPGDARNAYRDPAAVYHDGWFWIYFTWVRTEDDGVPYSYVAWSRSRDLVSWSSPVALTARDLNLNFGSPGDVVRYQGEWVMCLQTYPRPHGERYGNGDARVWSMQSRDLMHWSQPEILRVKGPHVPVEAMGRMIDPYLFQDKDVKGKWWCFYKQDGISRSWSSDLVRWTYAGKTEGGENPCVIVDRGEYVMFCSPGNGIAVKRSQDLEHWRDEGTLLLGQKDWPWAKGRLTAGFVLDLRREPRVGKALIFFHGSRWKEGDARGGFDTFASLGVAWSEDLVRWSWPGMA